MEYIFVVHLFGIIDVDTIFYKLSQTQNSLILIRSRIAFFLGQR